jgi:hypothetical protein
MQMSLRNVLEPIFERDFAEQGLFSMEAAHVCFRQSALW